MPLTFCCIAKKGRVTLLKDWYGAKVENNISLLELFNAFAAGELDELHQPLDEDEFGIFVSIVDLQRSSICWMNTIRSVKTVMERRRCRRGASGL